MILNTVNGYNRLFGAEKKVRPSLKGTHLNKATFLQ